MRVELSNDELAERGRELASLIAKLVSARRDKKDSARDYATTITDIEKRILQLSEVVRSGVEYQDDQGTLFLKDSEMVS